MFNLKSLVSPDEGSTLQNIQTQPGAAGANPTINTLIKFLLPLPSESLFCPRLACTVYDYIFKGFSQPMIGTFVIPIGDLIFKLKDERERETAAIDYILQELDKIIIDQGIMSYSVNNEEEMKDFSSESVKSVLRVETAKFRNSVIAPADSSIKQPLLLNAELLDNEE